MTLKRLILICRLYWSGYCFKHKSLYQPIFFDRSCPHCRNESRVARLRREAAREMKLVRLQAEYENTEK